jgi:hypothetical protein
MSDKGAAVKVFENIGDQGYMFPPKDRPIWAAVKQCFSENQPPLVDAVSVRLNGNSGYARVIAGQFNDIDNVRLEENLKNLALIGRTMLVRQYGQELTQVTPSNLEELTQTTINEIGNLTAQRSTVRHDAAGIDAELWKRLKENPWQPVPTGIKWIDDSIGGLWPTMNFWFVAPYKSYKTSIARNISLHASKSDYPVVFLAAEGERTMFVLDCQVMLATEYLILNGQHYQNVDLDSLKVLRAMSGRQGLTNVEWDAIEYGRETFKGLPIYVYDSGDNITGIATLKHTVRKAKLEHGAQLVWLDYSQLFGDSDNVVERGAELSRAIMEIEAKNEVALGLIGQQNEETVKGYNKSHSPGIKGGGDAPAAADGIFVSRVDPEMPGVMYLKAKLGRRFAGSKEHTHYVAASGLIVDNYLE